MDTPRDAGAHHRRTSSGFVQASKTTAGGAFTVRRMTISRSPTSSSEVGFDAGESALLLVVLPVVLLAVLLARDSAGMGFLR
jgi:hypothetical protein